VLILSFSHPALPTPTPQAYPKLYCKASVFSIQASTYTCTHCFFWISIYMHSLLLLQVPTMGQMVEMWKKQHNIFGILYSWFLAKARFNVFNLHLYHPCVCVCVCVCVCNLHLYHYVFCTQPLQIFHNLICGMF
jgi:hypothetical protein